jgi:hypothetical protein
MADTIKVLAEEQLNHTFVVLFNDSPHTGCTEVRGVAFTLEDAMAIISGSSKLREEVKKGFVWIEQQPIGVELTPDMVIEEWHSDAIAPNLGL